MAPKAAVVQITEKKKKAVQKVVKKTTKKKKVVKKSKEHVSLRWVPAWVHRSRPELWTPHPTHDGLWNVWVYENLKFSHISHAPQDKRLEG